MTFYRSIYEPSGLAYVRGMCNEQKIHINIFYGNKK